MNNKPVILVRRGSGIEMEAMLLKSSFSHQLCRLVWYCKPRIARKISTEWPGTVNYIPTLPSLAGKPIERLSVHQTFEDWYAKSRTYDFEYSQIINGELMGFHYEHTLAELAAALRAIALVQPDLILIKGGTRREAASLGTVAKHFGIPVMYSERGPFPQSTLLAPEIAGPAVFRSENALDTIEDHHMDDYIREYLSSGLSAWQQPELQGAAKLKKELGISDDEKIIFYAGQVETDANMVLQSHSPRFKTNASFLEFISKNVSHLKNVVLVVKPHPKEAADLSAFAESGCRTIISRNINIKEILPLSSAVVAINSTVGFEALLYGRPVVTGGNAFYSHRGFTFDIDDNNANELKRFLQNPQFSETQQSDFRNFARNFIRQHVYFVHPPNGLNGSDEYIARMVAACKKQSSEIPLDLILHAEEILSSVQTPIKLPPKKSPLHQLMRQVFPKQKQKTEESDTPA